LEDIGKAVLEKERERERQRDTERQRDKERQRETLLAVQQLRLSTKTILVELYERKKTCDLF
jgi:hypothetical protein